MNSLVRFTWLRSSGIFFSGVTLLLFTFFSIAPANAAQKSYRTRHTSANHHRTTHTQVQHSSKGRRIEVDLSRQRLIAWNGNKRVYSIPISTGKRSTPTPTGTYAIQSKLRSSHMRGRNYDVPNVPYTMYFSGGYAIHGAYWHHRFGTPVSHGCINLPVSQSRRLFNWASEGTRVTIHG
jgi:lipoprotein-anchoring transpeptidase ErfK/SrfK